MYILPSQTRTVTLYVTDPSTRQGGRPTTYKTKTFCYEAKIWPWVPNRGSEPSDCQ